MFVRWLTQSLRLDSGHYIGFPVEVDGSMDLSIPTDLLEAKKKIKLITSIEYVGFYKQE